MVKGGLVEGAVVDQAEVKKMATLPTRDAALGILVGSISSVIAMFAMALEARATQLGNESPAA